MQLQLRREHPDIEEFFPALPAKTWWMPPVDDEYLNTRGQELFEFLENLLTVFSNQRVLQAEAQTLHDFLKMKNFYMNGERSISEASSQSDRIK